MPPTSVQFELNLCLCLLAQVSPHTLVGLKSRRLVMNMVEMDLIKGDMFSLRKMSMELKIIMSRKKAEELQYEKVRVKIVDQVMRELRLEKARRRCEAWLDCRFSWRVLKRGT